MAKAVLAVCSCAAGITLCIWGNSAFAAIGVVLGIGALICGIYLLIGFFANKYFPLVLALIAIGLGILLIVLCVFIASVAFFLGGLVFSAAGIALIPFCRFNLKIILPLSGGCILCGIVIIFAPAFIGWITVLAGISLICYSHIVVIFMQT